MSTCPHSTRPDRRIDQCSLCTSAAFGFVPTRAPMGQSGIPEADASTFIRVDAHGRHTVKPKVQRAKGDAR